MFLTQLSTYFLLLWVNQILFFPLFSWNYLKNIRPYWKYMENQEFPTQCNLKHLRSLSFPFYFFLTNSVPATYFQAPMSRSCRWKCNCNCSCQCDCSCRRRSWRKSKQSWRSSTDCSSRDGKEMEKSGLVCVPALPNLYSFSSLGWWVDTRLSP